MTRVRLAASLAAASAFFAAGSAQALGPILIPGCGAFFGGGAPTICAGTQAQGTAGGVNFSGSPNPQQFSISSSTVAAGVAGGGDFGVSAGASATGTFGLFHLDAVADNGSLNAPGPHTGSALANADIRMSDGGVVGGTLGSLQVIHVAFDMNGLFSGSGEADAILKVADGFNTLLNISPFIWGPNPTLSFSQDFLVHGGDHLSMFLDVDAEAASSNDAFSAEPHSSADVSHTVHLFIDALTPGGGFTSLSGHDYASNPVAGPGPGVPEPAGWMLMILGFAAVGAAARRPGHPRRTA